MYELLLILRFVGSLWFAAVLLVLLLVGMACATVFESTHGAEQALSAFYRSWWFGGALALSKTLGRSPRQNSRHW